MTNREKLNQMSDEALSHFFCRAMEDIEENAKDGDWCCDLCPVKNLCRKGHTGFLTWLKQEAEEDA